jgi:SAM-dependent methyltransferase
VGGGQRISEAARTGQRLTDGGFWDEYWSALALPAEIKKSRSLYITEITGVLDRYFPRGSGLAALEIGGAPGQYLAYLHRTFGYAVTALDSSAAGCEKARANFGLLGIPGVVVEGDMFSRSLSLPRFDVVYSLGLFEHFVDPAPVVEAHLRLLKPGGVLGLGCPNYLGVNGVLLRRLSPGLLETVNLATMDIDAWQSFETAFGLEVLFKGYVGGFEPSLFWRRECDRTFDRGLALALRFLRRGLNRPGTKPLRRANSRLWSGYALGIYQYGATTPSREAGLVDLPRAS